MSESQPLPAASEVSKLPSFRETDLNPAPTLAWIETRIATIYTAARQEEKPPNLEHDVYLETYTAIHDYCTATKRKRSNTPDSELSAEDLYRGLERAIRSYCLDTRAYIFASIGDADDDRARKMTTKYVAQWDKFTHLTRLMTNLMRFLQRHWIQQQILEKRNKDIYLIEDLHNMIWKEEILQIGVNVTTAKRGSEEIVDAVTTLQRGDDTITEDDRELLKTIVESLSSFGLTVGD